jgi:hypothetical protein
LGTRGLTIVSGVAGAIAAGNGSNNSCNCVDATDGEVVRVRYEDIAGDVDCDGLGRVEGGVDCWAVVAAVGAISLAGEDGRGLGRIDFRRKPGRSCRVRAI